MENKQEKEKNPFKSYLSQIFEMLRKRDEIFVIEKNVRFNKTELRLLSEVVGAKTSDERIISTQLASRLGITRSAVSQIVNRLEEQGVLNRVAADDDKKIAYIEISDSIFQTYREEIMKCHVIVSGMVKEFGERKFEQLSALYNEFMDLVSRKVSEIKKHGCKCKQ